MEPSELLEEWGLREYIAKFDGKSPFFHWSRFEVRIEDKLCRKYVDAEC